MKWKLGCTAALAFALLPTGAQAQHAAGQVIWASGKVAVISPDKIVRALAKGDPVHAGETISTGPDSHVQILMSDQGLIALRPESNLRLTTYTYEGRNDGSERAVVDLIKGGIRSITGAIGSANKDNQLIRSGNVLVGIRGTDHETFQQPDAGTWNRVTAGGTYLQGPSGRIDLSPGEIGFAGAPGDAQPRQLQRTPDFMQLTRVSVPAGAPFNEGVIAHGKRTVPGQAAMPMLPVQAWGENASQQGFARGGRCAGPCDVEVLAGRGVGKAIGKGNGRAQ